MRRRDLPNFYRRNNIRFQSSRVAFGRPLLSGRVRTVGYKIGVIADDFTGASDAASFLVKRGYPTALFTGPKESLLLECDCLVVALKIRSVEPQQALAQVAAVLDFFEKAGVEKIYYKYCSTFDSTPRGNIGVVSDYLLEYADQQYTLLCPSLPINGRTVRDGVLYVNGVALSESPMKSHPLNPMWDSSIASLMVSQSKYPCHTLAIQELEDGVYQDRIALWARKSPHFYLIPDYVTDEDGEVIGKHFSDLVVNTGGSGLLEHLLPKRSCVPSKRGNRGIEPAILLCGSCSVMTGKQIRAFVRNGGNVISVNSANLINGEVTSGTVFAEIQKNQPMPTLVFSDAVFDDMEERAQRMTFYQEASAMESFLAELGMLAKQNAYQRIVIAGGETSGAVAISLGYQAFYLGRIVAPGVPELIPVDDPSITLVMKSGNFGGEDFFEEALR